MNYMRWFKQSVKATRMRTHRKFEIVPAIALKDNYKIYRLVLNDPDDYEKIRRELTYQITQDGKYKVRWEVEYFIVEGV